MKEVRKSVQKSKVRSTFRDIIPLSFGEEIGNTVSHGAAALITLLLLPYAAVLSYINGGILQSFSVSVFVISLFLMFLSSTIYHAMANDSSHKFIMRIIDHSMIYLAISGTYTPVCLVVVGGWLGWLVMIILWSLTLWGILYKSLVSHVNHKLSMVIYLVMGWIGVLLVPFIISHTSILFMLFILLGGLAYTIGAWFYAQKERAYFHMIWHLFIVMASAFHLIAIVYFI
ncbi:hemolysin III family protein [Staphylococcus sp. SQ8-PEA]|uniref:Hemolysin III family protein n=1 Tax=Staphylococcus marylandisciuri TaxID=2981529 RepID=A0ABT2QMC7_9STAP|nr:hemolysin III family protein [Staphylococcus marylandisciuri]MCU5745104.1 hemolysin III family protein [Staphylococcus marylandisciuri]